MRLSNLFSIFKRKKDKKYYKPDQENVLVTGGAGFIGSHLCQRLLQDGKKVICMDSLEGGRDVRNIKTLLQKPNFKFIKQDITKKFDFSDFPELKDLKLDIYGIQKVYHLALPTSVKNFDDLKLQTLYTNSLGTINMLELAKHYGAKFLLASSFVIYGPRAEHPFKESDPGSVNTVANQSCFDEGKRFAETAVATYKQQFRDLDAKIARIFRTYGPKQPLFDGQMIPDFGIQALTNKPLIIYGDKNFSTSICYISDVIDGIVKLMRSEEPGPVNIGSDKVYNLAALAKKIIEMTGSKSSIEFREPLPFMRPLGIPDINLAKETLDWFPITDLEKGLTSLIEYLKAHRTLLDPMTNQYDE